MGKSSSYFKGSDCTLKQDASGATLVTEAAAAFEEPASAIRGQAVAGYLLEGTLALDSGLAPHQPVVSSLHSLGLGADCDCARPTGGGESCPVQHHKVGRKRKGFLFPAINEDSDLGHPTILGSALRLVHLNRQSPLKFFDRASPWLGGYPVHLG